MNRPTPRNRLGWRAASLILLLPLITLAGCVKSTNHADEPPTWGPVQVPQLPRSYSMEMYDDNGTALTIQAASPDVILSRTLGEIEAQKIHVESHVETWLGTPESAESNAFDPVYDLWARRCDSAEWKTDFYTLNGVNITRIVEPDGDEYLPWALAAGRSPGNATLPDGNTTAEVTVVAQDTGNFTVKMALHEPYLGSEGWTHSTEYWLLTYARGVEVGLPHGVVWYENDHRPEPTATWHAKSTVHDDEPWIREQCESSVFDFEPAVPGVISMPGVPQGDLATALEEARKGPDAELVQEYLAQGDPFVIDGRGGTLRTMTGGVTGEQYFSVELFLAREGERDALHIGCIGATTPQVTQYGVCRATEQQLSSDAELPAVERYYNTKALGRVLADSNLCIHNVDVNSLRRPGVLSVGGCLEADDSHGGGLGFDLGQGAVTRASSAFRGLFVG